MKRQNGQWIRVFLSTIPLPFSFLLGCFIWNEAGLHRTILSVFILLPRDDAPIGSCIHEGQITSLILVTDPSNPIAPSCVPEAGWADVVNRATNSLIRIYP